MHLHSEGFEPGSYEVDEGFGQVSHGRVRRDGHDGLTRVIRGPDDRFHLNCVV